MSAATLRADGAGDSTPASDGGERITRLFPKCRPRNMQRQHERVVLEGREVNNVNNLSSDEDRCENTSLNHNSKDPYKLRDSRIIEIAGGRELYSASRTKALRKLRHTATQKHNIRNKRTNKDSMEYATDNLNTEISLTRISNDKRTMSRHSPPYTNGDCESPPHMSIPRNSSPILDPHKTADSSAKSSPIAVVADGELVVFDDNEDWKGMRTDGETSDIEVDKRTLDNMRRCDSDLMNNRSEQSSEESGSSSSECGWRGAGGSVGATGALGVGGALGELAIAQYEGSPRRYGRAGPPQPPVQLTQLAVAAQPARPGFPQRVVTESREPTPPSSSAAFDYLYEFSETRKVLEEFFRCPALAGQNGQSDEIVNFQELEYSLRRGAGSPGAGVGAGEVDETGELGEGGEVVAELAGSVADTWAPLASPHAAHNHTDFLGLQQVERSQYSRSPNVSALSVGGAWSESASPAGHGGGGGGGGTAGGRALGGTRSRNSDLDSTPDIDSDTELMLMENELSELKGLSECGRGGVQLPVVEDGLSSGHASDHDNNNQRDSLKTHTSVIMEEVVENGTSSEPHVLSDADLHSLDPLAARAASPPPPAPAPHRDAEPDTRKRPSSAQSTESVEIKATASGDEDEADTDLETDRLLGQQRTDDQGFFDDKGWRKPKSRTVMPAGGASAAARSPPHAATDATDNADDRLSNKDKDGKKKSKNKEEMDHSVLIEGVLFRARYLGSTQLACEGQPTKATRMLQAEEAVSRIKAPEGENQPSTEVDLFISTEKIMVLNTELKEIMMDHALRTISYIADIGDLVVLMARRRFVPHETDSDQPKLNRTPKMICHVFESEEAQFIAQSIGQAFQVAYMEFLKANGIEDHSFVKEMDYQEVLNSQEIFGDELQMFAKKELQKEVVVPKAKGEILGVVVVESGWGSMLPTVVIANLAPAGAAARCSHLNIGDQIIAINGVSLVGLPLSTCQTYIKNSKNQTVVKLTVVPCAPVVEVKIKRPDTKYQLGFSVQNGVICSLLRGGIAERGGVRVGHRIIEINCQSVVAVPHERIVNLLATSVGEILMKTMPTSMFRLLTGQENPVFI